MVAADQGMRNRMTSDDAATILNLIASGKLINEQMSELAMSFLLQQTINAGLTDAIPAGVQVAHKTGELIQAEHDGGIVLAAHPYVLVVMTEGIDNYLGVSVIADVSRAVYVATNGDEPGVFFTPDYSYDGGADYGWSDEVPGGSGETGGTTVPSEPTQPGTGTETGGETGGTAPEPGTGGAGGTTGGEGSGETGGAGAGSGSEGAGGSGETGGAGGSGGAEAPDPGAGDSGSAGGSEGGAGETGGSSTDTAEGE